MQMHKLRNLEYAFLYLYFYCNNHNNNRTTTNNDNSTMILKTKGEQFGCNHFSLYNFFPTILTHIEIELRKLLIKNPGESLANPVKYLTNQGTSLKKKNRIALQKLF